MSAPPKRPLPRARRSLGQNFLINPGVRDKIIAALQVQPADWVVELGPGPGVLSAPLSERCAHLVAVELDPRLAADLPEVVPHPERLEVTLQDGAKLDYRALAARAGALLRVVGNLPFNAATAMLHNALGQADAIERLVLMFQREVGQRLVAAPGTKAYGSLTVATAARATGQRLFDVSPGSFHPAPKVAAMVLQFSPRRPGLPPCCLAQLDRFLRQVFAHRRKTLRNGLRRAPWPWELSQQVLQAEGVRPEQRAQEVPPAAYERMARALCDALGTHDPARPAAPPQASPEKDPA